MSAEVDFGAVFYEKLDENVRLTGEILTYDTKDTQGRLRDDEASPSVVEVVWPQRPKDCSDALELTVTELKKEGLQVETIAEDNTFLGHVALKSRELGHDELRGLLGQIGPVSDYQETVAGTLPQSPSPIKDVPGI